MKKYIIVIVLCVNLILSCSALDTVKIVMPSGDTLTLEVADTQELRAKGLMFRKEMKDNHGMIFVFEDIAIRNFWMKNTLIPLSIAYLDSNGVVLHIADMEPQSLRAVSSIYPAKFAIEVNQGMFDEFEVSVGVPLMLPHAIIQNGE